MHARAALLNVLSAVLVCAQTPQDPEVARAQARLDYTRSLVEQGIAPRAELEGAQLAVEEAEENAFLKRTLYGADVSEPDAERMVAITERRLERRLQAVTKARELVDQGAAPRLSLTPVLQQADWARKEHDYAVTRAKLVHEMAEMAREEAAFQAKLQNAPLDARDLAERYDGDGNFTPGDFARINRAFARAFAKDLPVSANGATAVHRALGFDHRGRVDVALNPDQPEGIWLRRFLTANHIPYFAFRLAVPGKATGPHIHIGPMSERIAQGG